MIKINVQVNCNNAPKKEFIKNFNIAFATGNVASFLTHIDENIQWTIHGDKTITGKKQFQDEIISMSAFTADEITIENIITHGAVAAVNGTFSINRKSYSFCDIYRFKSAGSLILKTIDSYLLGAKKSK
ncbi:nuclear transport factor 2 family protein [Flavobacterium sp. UMI-01]|uniref:nuclear transport factor 2 family protein n=1 Tax=Flavobacterium sp. UMI-01 TaxID=1441053 RepID=UPI001C7D14DE|nr:nuclear transport factor 2 family protein [Flavobacterium sp. UMI-01]GIZ07617.1 hypothetical protein FUMI01_03440 [Flavobacterium sp. UMI-01]